MRTLVIFLLMLAAVLPAAAGASDGARTLGFGAGLASLDDGASMILTNPGALSLRPGTRLSVAATVIVPEARFTAPGGSSVRTQSSVLFPPTLCLSHTTAGGFALGVGVGMPMLGRRDWDPGWTGRLHAIRSEHRALVIAPGIAIPLSSTLSVGAAMDFTVGRVNFARRVSLPGGEATLSLLADGMTAIGYHVGAVLEVSRIVQLGASFRAPVTMRSDNVRGTYGDAAAGVTPALADEELQVEITRPSAVQAQLLFKPFGFLRIAGSIERESWGGRATRIVRRSTGETIADWTAGWGSSLTYAAGVEILAGDVALRFSMRRATSAAEPASLHPALPDADGILYGGGFGYRVDAGLFLDVGFTHAESADAPVTASRLSPPLSGTYTLTGTMVGLTITYVWNTND